MQAQWGDLCRRKTTWLTWTTSATPHSWCEQKRLQCEQRRGCASCTPWGTHYMNASVPDTSASLGWSLWFGWQQMLGRKEGRCYCCT